MAFPQHIFKAYDIRGLVEGELSIDLAYGIGRAFTVFLKNKGFLRDGRSVVVGQDMRKTSPGFAEAVIRGITDEGASVVDIGQATTPLFNFACAHYPEHAGGIMVTASHNPAEYNGFKMTLDNGLPVGKASGMAEIRDMVEKNVFTDAVTKGSVSTKSVLEDYYTRVFSLVSPKTVRPLKLVLDSGNGMGKVTFVELLKRLPVTVEYLFLEPDGTFPNHEANPLKTSTLRDLQAKVRETGADFGFALDGDADRIGLVDEHGDIVDASFVGALVGLEVLKVHPGAMMFFDLRSSMITPEKSGKLSSLTELDRWPRGQRRIKNFCEVGDRNHRIKMNSNLLNECHRNPSPKGYFVIYNLNK
jgi:phosphomannomutase